MLLRPTYSPCASMAQGSEEDSKDRLMALLIEGVIPQRSRKSKAERAKAIKDSGGGYLAKLIDAETKKRGVVVKSQSTQGSSTDGSEFALFGGQVKCKDDKRENEKESNKAQAAYAQWGWDGVNLRDKEKQSSSLTSLASKINSAPAVAPIAMRKRSASPPPGASNKPLSIAHKDMDVQSTITATFGSQSQNQIPCSNNSNSSSNNVSKKKKTDPTGLTGAANKSNKSNNSNESISSAEMDLEMVEMAVEMEAAINNTNTAAISASGSSGLSSFGKNGLLGLSGSGIGSEKQVDNSIFFDVYDSPAPTAPTAPTAPSAPIAGPAPTAPTAPTAGMKRPAQPNKANNANNDRPDGRDPLSSTNLGVGPSAGLESAFPSLPSSSSSYFHPHSAVLGPDDFIGITGSTSSTSNTGSTGNTGSSSISGIGGSSSPGAESVAESRYGIVNVGETLDHLNTFLHAVETTPPEKPIGMALIWTDLTHNHTTFDTKKYCTPGKTCHLWYCR